MCAQNVAQQARQDQLGDCVPRRAATTKVPARELERVLKAAHDSALFPVSWRQAIRCSLLMLDAGGRGRSGKGSSSAAVNTASDSMVCLRFLPLKSHI